MRSLAIDLVVIDSVAALVPRAELEGEMGDSHMGLQARLMSQALRKLTASIHRSNCIVIFTNQIRQKIGVMFGNPETTTGGNALKFYASVRLDIRRIGQIKDRDQAVGNQTRVKVVKNKVAPPFRVVEFDIMYGEGISKTGELLDLGGRAGVVEKSGSWFSYDSQRIGQGRENAKAYLRSIPRWPARRGRDPRPGRSRRRARHRHRPARRGPRGHGRLRAARRRAAGTLPVFAAVRQDPRAGRDQRRPGLVGHQDRQLGVIEHVLGHAAEHHLAHAAVRIGADDQEVGGQRRRFGEQNVAHAARALLDVAHLGGDAARPALRLARPRSAPARARCRPT